MGPFFRGWRRKAGSIVLLIAIMLMVAWFRSYGYRDLLYVATDGNLYWIDSSFGGVTCASFSPVSDSHRAKPIQWRSHKLKSPIPMDPSSGQAEWSWKWGGFYFEAGKNKLLETSWELYFIPYWALVLPPALIAAWLILWRPKLRRQQVTEVRQ